VQTDLVQSLFEAPVGTSGNDILATLESTFGSIDGGSGFDRLNFVQDGAIDLTAAGNSLNSVEVLDSNNNVSNSLTVDVNTVLQADDHSLYVLGDNGDSLQLQGLWNAGDSYNVSSDLTLDSYTSLVNNQSLTVFVDSNVSTSVA
jgi:hypothetical protein